MQKSYYANVGAYLKEQRLKVGLGQRDLGRMLKIDSQLVWNWENGKSYPPSARLHTVIKILKVNKHVLAEKMIEDRKVEIKNTLFKKAS